MEKLKASYYFTAALFKVCQCFHYELQFSGVYNSAVKICFGMKLEIKVLHPKTNSPPPPFFFKGRVKLNLLIFKPAQLKKTRDNFFVTFCTITKHGLT